LARGWSSAIRSHFVLQIAWMVRAEWSLLQIENIWTAPLRSEKAITSARSCFFRPSRPELAPPYLLLKLCLTPPQALPRPQGGCHQRKRDGDGHRRLRGGWSTSWCACPWRPSGRPPHLPPPWSKAQGAAPILPSPLPVSSNRVVRRCCRCRGVVRSGGATGCKGAVRAWTDSHWRRGRVAGNERNIGLPLPWATWRG
jgi:hypothetical protein